MDLTLPICPTDIEKRETQLCYFLVFFSNKIFTNFLPLSRSRYCTLIPCSLPGKEICRSPSWVAKGNNCHIKQHRVLHETSEQFSQMPPELLTNAVNIFLWLPGNILQTDGTTRFLRHRDATLQWLSMILGVVRKGGVKCRFWLPSRKFSKSERSKYKFNRKWILLTEYTVSERTVKISWQCKFSTSNWQFYKRTFELFWNQSASYPF